MSLPPSSLHGGSKAVSTQPVDDDYSDSGSDSDAGDRHGTFASAGAANAELDDWSEGEEDEEEQDDPALCLFCTTQLATQVELKAHLSEKHGFDFRAVANALGLDFYSQMKVINYIREKRSQGETDTTIIQRFKAPNAVKSPELAFLFDGSESYLKPFLPEDTLLFSLPKHTSGKSTGDDDEDDDEEQKSGDASSTAAPATEAASSSAPSVTALLQENQSLRNELESMQEAMRTMQLTLKRVAFAEEEGGDAPPSLDTSSTAPKSEAASTTASPATQVAVSAKPSKKPTDGSSGSFAPEHIDRDYFGGYSTRNIHELMLRDTIRTEAYRDFIYNAPELFKDKVVLDVGCGTGILSLFAAKMGAKKVIGVDAADIVHKAREIITANGMNHIIEIVHGKMEEVVLPVDKVDIIISEWMGYFLLFESMLPSVLYARDKYLREKPSKDQPLNKATGVYPDKAIMYISGIETSESKKQRLDWWNNVYGFNMSCLVEEREKFQSSTVEIVRPSQVITTVALLKEIDCNFVTDNQLDFEQEFELQVTNGAEPFTGFMVYFDTLFALHCKSIINLSTAPMKDHAPQPELTTHWQQSVFYLAKPLQVKEKDVIHGKLKAKRMSSNPRAYDVIIDYSLTRDGQRGVTNNQEYKVQ